MIVGYLNVPYGSRVLFQLIQTYPEFALMIFKKMPFKLSLNFYNVFVFPVTFYDYFSLNNHFMIIFP